MTFDNMAVTALSSPPSPWVDADIGSPATAGKGVYEGTAGVFTVAGAGNDIWGTSDQFHYLYQPAAGDVELIAHVTAVQNTATWGRTGVMIRESSAANSRYALAFISPQSNTQVENYQCDALGLRLAQGESSGAVRPSWIPLRLTCGTHESMLATCQK